MRVIYAIFKREFKNYFDSPVAYVYIGAFTGLMGWLSFRMVLMSGQAELRGFFDFLPWVLLFIVPAITMRLWAEEKKLGTIELLMTFPVRDYEVVLGKFLAGFLLLAVTVLSTFPLVITVQYLGEPDLGPLVGGYVGALLMGAAYLSIGIFASSLCESQIVAFILGVLFCFALFIVGKEFCLMALPESFVPVFEFIGLGNHFESVGRGVIDSRDGVYYLSVIGFFLFLNLRAVESRKWS